MLNLLKLVWGFGIEQVHIKQLNSHFPMVLLSKFWVYIMQVCVLCSHYDGMYVCGYVQANITMKWEATHMNSSEGENIAFLSSTLLEGPVEVRVCGSVYVVCQ